MSQSATTALPGRRRTTLSKSFLGCEKEVLSKYVSPNVESFQQFTGLHDKEGAPIYEGDILRVAGCERAQEVLCAGSRISIRSVPNNDDYEELWQQTICDIEIIGNIYENPELVV